ncbi:MAG: Mov34/MPN/PAD-1 family protein [Planctomycetaceae bacterium]|nr:Mov34/MPN/PAD-1 family protein [Planctomycetaceae bacterium]
MSDEMSFGELQVVQPQLALRPDQDPHLAVVSVGTPEHRQLRIYVDFATLQAIEEHVHQDTSIELGGVLLGGQYVDDQGQPFVVVREALDGQHFEATKGSFKFTHDTWQDLLQRTASYPETTRMVGWYHSHPGWGIFLSDLDMFICRGFFNNPLDVALVVDPCQDYRGWFHWPSAMGRERRQQNSGFYLFDSRHRLPQLQRAAELLNEAESDMSSTSTFAAPRSGTGRALSRSQTGDSVAPAQVFVAQSDQTWPLIVLMAMLSLQTILIALVGWSVWTMPRESRTTAESKESAYREVLAAMIATADPGLSPALTKQRIDALANRQQELQELRTQSQLFQVAAESSQKQTQETLQKLEATTVDLQKAHAVNRDLDARIKSLELAKQTSANDTPTGLGGSWWTSPWVSTGIGALGLVLGAALGGWWISRRQPGLETFEKD